MAADVVAVIPRAPYVVRVVFADGAVRDIDIAPLLDGQVFGPLRDPEEFATARVDPETRTLAWPNGADLDPDVLYDPTLKPAGQRARRPRERAHEERPDPRRDRAPAGRGVRRGAGLQRLRSAVAAASGIAPYLPAGHEYAERVRAPDAERQRRLDARRER